MFMYGFTTHPCGQVELKKKKNCGWYKNSAIVPEILIKTEWRKDKTLAR